MIDITLLLLVLKCICENVNGGFERNTWRCENNSSFISSKGCDDDEWCIGPTSEESATLKHNDLCTKSKFNLF